MNPPTRVERAWQIYLAIVQASWSNPDDSSSFEVLAKAAFTAERKFMEEAGK